MTNKEFPNTILSKTLTNVLKSNSIYEKTLLKKSQIFTSHLHHFQKFFIEYLKISSFIVFMMSFCIKSGAQIPDPPLQNSTSSNSSIYIISKSFGDSIIIRWAPDNIESWLKGNVYGYVVYRYHAVENNTNILTPPVRELKTSQSIKPLNVKTIEKQYGADPYAAIVAQAIHGKTFDVNSKKTSGDLLNLADELSNRYSFALFACDMSMNAAKSHGLVYIDKDVRYGDKYLYCIKPAWHDSTVQPDSASVFIAVNDTFTPPHPINVHARFEEKSVIVSWNAEAIVHAFTAYLVERSDDDGKNFHQINTSPVINISESPGKPVMRMAYTDTIPLLEKEYFYRVRGITPFGETGPPSEVVSGMGNVFIVGVNPIITGSENLSPEGLKILWEFPVEHEKDITGFTIEHSGNANGIYEKIGSTLPVQQRSFVHKEAKTVNYYQVCAIGKSGNQYCSFPALAQLPDSVPPAMPTGLTGAIDSAGVVQLSWERNIEEDLMSYKIFRSYNPANGYIQVNREMHSDNTYSDTIPLNNLTGKVFYTVTAQDFNYNESAKPAPCMLIKPDTIPPVPPVLKKYHTENGKITLEWLASSSNDVVAHTIYRRAAGSSNWELVMKTDSARSSNIFVDTPPHSTLLEYLITATDAGNLESIKDKYLTVKSSESKKDATELLLTLNVSDNGKAIKLSWNANRVQADKILIFKATDDKNYVLVATVPAKVNAFADSNVKPGNTYYYRSQIIYNNGARDRLSRSFKIII